MKVQVNTDNNVVGSDFFSERTEADLTSVLSRFESRLTRVEVHLRNESAGRSTGDDFRCMVEARPAGAEPVTVTHHGATLLEALHGATDKLETLLTGKFERREGQQTRETIRGR